MANLKNLQRLQYHGATVRGLQEHNDAGRGHLEIILPTGRAIGYGRPPTLTDGDRFTAETAGLNDPERMEFEDDVTSLIAIRSLMPLVKLSKVIVDTEADKRLSEAGKREKVFAMGSEAVKVISTQAASLRREQDGVHRLEVELFDQPLIMAKDDHVSIALDREIRDRYLKSDGTMDSSAIGETFRNARIAAAMLRSPIAVNAEISKRMRETWRAAVAEREPQKFSTWKTAADNAEWAASVVNNAARLVVEHAALPPIKVYEAAHPAGGIHAFGISEPMQRTFAHQLASAA